MNICKNTIRWVLLLDILLALSVVLLLTVLEFGTVPQHRIGFYCNDPKISFKFMGDTISITLLFIGSLLTPILVMWLAESLCYPAESYDVTAGYAGTRAKQVWLWFGHYTIGFVALTFICDVMKTLIGEPRPHFLDTCRPREAVNCTDEYVDAYTCTNTVDSDWFVSDSSKSFPSGHSALSMYTAIFLMWYLQTRLPDRTFFLKPWLQCMMCLWTVTCSLTRIADNRHHWWDVLAGDVLGLIFAVLTVTVSCQRFRHNRNVSQIYNEPIENGQINFGDKKHQRLSESRELKSTPSTWKERPANRNVREVSLADFDETLQVC